MRDNKLIVVDLGSPVEIIRVRKRDDVAGHCIVDYRTEATGTFEFSLIVEAIDEMDAYAKFPNTLAYWQRKSVYNTED